MSQLRWVLRRLGGRLIELQIGRPWVIVALALLTALPAFFAARRLGLKTDFSELLPENKPSVVEMRRVSQKLTSASTLTIVAEVTSPNPGALKAFADAVAPRIAALGPEWVGGVDAGNQEARAFFDRNKLLYAPLDKLKKLHDDLRERYDYEVHERLGDNLDLEGEGPPRITAATLREQLSVPAVAQKDDFGGYYIGEGGRLLAILIRTPVEGGSIEPARRLRAKIEEIIHAVAPPHLDPSMVIRYTGDFITSIEEYEAVKKDLGHVGIYGVVMVLGVVLLFFLRIRTLLALAIAVGIGILWTFGLTRYTIGYLNSSTGFLVSIIAGNGINFGIIFMARYHEARRVSDEPLASAIRPFKDSGLPAGAAIASPRREFAQVRRALP